MIYLTFLTFRVNRSFLFCCSVQEPPTVNSTTTRTSYFRNSGASTRGPFTERMAFLSSFQRIYFGKIYLVLLVGFGNSMLLLLLSDNDSEGGNMLV